MDFLKNTLNNGIQSAYKTLKAPPTTSQFKESGMLSPDEYVTAGDKLCQVSPQWQWQKASDAKHNYQYLPENKQFLVLQECMSEERLKDMVKRAVNHKEIETEDGWVIQEMSKEEENKQEEKQENKEEKQDNKEEPELRNYTVYICYDAYYYCPRLFLEATLVSDDENIHGKPVKPNDIFEDIAGEKVGTTVTIETHPGNGLQMATIHPCKHSQILKRFADQMREGRSDDAVGSHLAILIFLKFFHDVIPTIDFDTNFDLVLD